MDYEQIRSKEFSIHVSGNNTDTTYRQFDNTGNSYRALTNSVLYEERLLEVLQEYDEF